MSQFDPELILSLRQMSASPQQVLFAGSWRLPYAFRCQFNSAENCGMNPRAP
jgi:hypothetical protein